MERLGRGLVAVPAEAGGVFVSWRYLATDSPSTTFNLYRLSKTNAPKKINETPLNATTWFHDRDADPAGITGFMVKSVVEGREQNESSQVWLPANNPPQRFIRIPLQTPKGYMPNDCSVGDLDGDGEYDLVVHQAGRGRDNSQAGITDSPILEAYRLDGTFLWRIDLGPNIREGAHYTQFIVYDLDGDGKAEVACKTADGTKDGLGKTIGDATAIHRSERGFILQGPEFLTVFDGTTGRALATTNYIPARGKVQDWGDATGNRADRFLACVAYLDGQRPSLIMCRGYYTRAVLAAWNWRDGKLANVWTFDSDDGSPSNTAYRGQGNHNLAVADVDQDGEDEILYGAACVDDSGKGLYSTGCGHGDAMHVSDLDPSRPGLEVFAIHERPRHANGAELHDAATGRLLWGKLSQDVARGVAMDVDPRHPGCEMWAAGAGLSGMWNAKGHLISERRPRSCNFGVWWDGDLLRELLDRNVISKWNWADGTESRLLVAEGCSSNNGSKATPALCADILGDWREEVVWRSSDGKELRLYTTTSPTEYRLRTLMQDPQYRLSVAWQNVGYNQPTQPGFYLGHGMKLEPPPSLSSPK